MTFVRYPHYSQYGGLCCRQLVTLRPGLLHASSIKTARFLGFSEALLQVGHRYGELGIDTDMVLARVRRETTKAQPNISQEVFMKAGRNQPENEAAAIRVDSISNETIFVESSEE